MTFLQIFSDFLIAIQKNGKYVVTALTSIKTFLYIVLVS